MAAAAARAVGVCEAGAGTRRDEGAEEQGGGSGRGGGGEGGGGLGVCGAMEQALCRALRIEDGLRISEAGLAAFEAAERSVDTDWMQVAATMQRVRAYAWALRSRPADTSLPF